MERKVFNVYVITILIYGCETRSPIYRHLQKIKTCQHKIERRMLGITLRDEVRISTIERETTF